MLCLFFFVFCFLIEPATPAFNSTEHLFPLPTRVPFSVPVAQAGKPQRGAAFVTAPPPDVVLAPALSAPGAYEMVTGQAHRDTWIERLRAADEFAVDTE